MPRILYGCIGQRNSDEHGCEPRALAARTAAGVCHREAAPAGVLRVCAAAASSFATTAAAAAVGAAGAAAGLGALGDLEGVMSTMY